VRRRPSSSRALTLGWLVVLAASCTSQPVILPSRDFDRPTDIAFVCMGTFAGSASGAADGGAEATDAASSGSEVLSGRPMRECHQRGTIDMTDSAHHTFAFLPNSSNGQLSVIDADRWSLVNLELPNSGFTGLPLGVLPTQIAASDDGCRLVTANHGSCDLSFVDPSAVLASTVARDTNKSVTSASPTTVINVVPKTKNSGRELRVLAGEVAFLPQNTGGLTSNQSLCPSPGDANDHWQALATFPSCDLVAVIDLPSGVIQKAAYAKKTAGDSVELVALAEGEDPVCPVDCTFPPPGDASAEASSDGGAIDAGTPEADGAGPDTSDGGAPEGGAVEAGAPEAAPPPVDPDPGDVRYIGAGALRPGPIAIIPEVGPARAYVGLANAAFVLALEVDQNQLVPGSAIALHEGALGVDRIRLSIDPYKDKTTPPQFAGSFVGNDPALDLSKRQVVQDRQYLYVIARDGTLRVVQVAYPGSEHECETNLDFVSMDPTTRMNNMNDACPQVTGPAVRKPGAVGPGIRLPTPPLDVAVADVRTNQSSPVDRSETSVWGTHAWVMTASGNVYLVNIDPVTRNIGWVPSSGDTVLACESPANTATCQGEPDPAPNTLRNHGFVGFTPSLDPSIGLPRLDVPPAQSTIGPRIESVWTQGSAANATAITADYLKTYVFFPRAQTADVPDPSTVTPQSWFVTWEGNLLPNPRLTGQIIADPTSGTSLEDIGMDFCRLGVQQSDLVTLQGCTADTQCGLNEKCVLGSNGAEGAGGFPITGLCMPTTVDSTDCEDLLSTIKRYDVTSARRSILGIEPHKDEIVRPNLKPCVVTSGPGADAGADGGVDASAPRDAGLDGLDAKDAGTDAPTSMVAESDCVDLTDPSTANFQCIEGRCLYPCKVVGQTAGCRPGRICADFGTANDCSDGQCYCADGPWLLGKKASSKAMVGECLGELLAYQVGVGRGFAVTGSQTALPATGIADASGACVPFPNLDPRTSVRIPMDAPRCAAPLTDNTLDSRCNPSKNAADPGCPAVDNLIPLPSAADPMALAAAEKARQDKAAEFAGELLKNVTTPNDPNPCLFIGGPNEADTPNTSPLHVHALYRNREIQFMLTNLERSPTGVFQIRFDVHGGFQAQTVAIPSTVEVTMPTRLVLGPFNANTTATTAGGITTTAEVPYLFVVDQRRLGRTQGGGPTRGQLLRIHPLGFAISTPVAGSQPWFEDLSHSNNLFPIQ
jgi:hypothetical protein